jgi:hypothetical protein
LSATLLKNKLKADKEKKLKIAFRNCSDSWGWG